MDDRAIRLTPREWFAIGLGSGLFGGLALVAPIVVWDWIRSGHETGEVAMGVTAWVFGLEHFSHELYRAGPMLVGGVLLATCSAVGGLVFTGLADRVYGLERPFPSLAGGVAWAFVSFVFFWDMLLPIGRDGAPLRGTTGTRGFVAPNWVWILGFALLGFVTAFCYWRLRRSVLRQRVRNETGASRALRDGATG